MSLLETQLGAISFLDSLSFGLFLPLQTPHFTDIGGNCLNLGLYGSLYTIGCHASDSITNSGITALGSKMYLLASLSISFLTIFPLICIKNLYVVILLRLIYASTNKTKEICKDILSNDEEQVDFLDYCNVIGYVLGATCAGFLYQSNDFACVAKFASLASLFACFVAKFLADAEGEIQTFDILSGLEEKANELIETIKGVDLNSFWDVLLIKFLSTMSIFLFLIKFNFIVKHNFHVNYAVIGYTYAFHYIMSFLSSYTSQYLIENFNINYDSNMSFITFVILLIVHSPTYEVYLLLVIVYMTLITLLKSTWNEVLDIRGVTPEQDEAVGIIAECISPMILGIACQTCDVYGFIDLITMPMVLALGVLLFYTSVAIDQIKKRQKQESASAPSE